MLPAVELNDEFRLATDEIHNERADQSLSSKVRTNQRDVVTKPLPKHMLGIGRLGAHLTRKLPLAVNHRVQFNHIRHRLWTPTPDPSPQGGGEKRCRRIEKT